MTTEFMKPKIGLKIRMPDKQMQHMPADGCEVSMVGEHGAYYRRLKRDGDIVKAVRAKSAKKEG